MRRAIADEAAGVSEYVEWVGLLKSCCAFEAYCRHYTADLRPRRIAEFLVLNADFPRIDPLRRRPRAGLARRPSAALTGRSQRPRRRLAGRLLASLDYGQMDEIIGEPAGVSSGHRAAGEPDQRRRAPAVHRLPDRQRAVA